MSDAQMHRTLDLYEEYLAAHQYEGQINLTGGEPLLHPSFFELAEEIRSRGLRLGVLTNGTLITEKEAERLAALRPMFIQVSLDGPKEIHEEIRGVGTFDKAMEGIDHLKQQNVRAIVSFTAMKSNYASFGKLARACRKHHVDKLWWDRVVTDDPAVFLSTEEFRAISRKAHRLRRRYPFISNNRTLQWIPGGECTYECNAGKRLLVLLANGDLMPCRRLPFVIGNIADVESLADFLDHDKTMKTLARPVFPEKCIDCEHLLKCGAGSKCVTYAQTGKIDACDVNCYLRTTI